MAVKRKTRAMPKAVKTDQAEQAAFEERAAKQSQAIADELLRLKADHPLRVAIDAAVKAMTEDQRREVGWGTVQMREAIMALLADAELRFHEETQRQMLRGLREEFGSDGGS